LSIYYPHENKHFKRLIDKYPASIRNMRKTNDEIGLAELYNCIFANHAATDPRKIIRIIRMTMRTPVDTFKFTADDLIFKQIFKLFLYNLT
jgi:hypothetical protein